MTTSPIQTSTASRQVRRLSAPFLLATAAAAAIHTQLAADTFGSEANSFTVDFVTVAGPGNPPDETGYGSVPYTYRIGAYEVSRGMITKANAPLADGGGNLGITMADMSSYGGNGMNRPATGVSWYEAARFVNWLNTSTGKVPAYKLSEDNFALWTPGEAGYDVANPYRNRLAMYFLPSDDEWYKAAYYSAASGVFYDYPTGSNYRPTTVAAGVASGTAVFHPQSGPADIQYAGGLSPNGTMAQGGNVWEWCEGAYDQVSDDPSEDRVMRGGDWDDPPDYMGTMNRFGQHPLLANPDIGFRVAAVPEPQESAGVVGVAAVGLALWRRRGSG